MNMQGIKITMGYEQEDFCTNTNGILNDNLGYKAAKTMLSIFCMYNRHRVMLKFTSFRTSTNKRKLTTYSLYQLLWVKLDSTSNFEHCIPVRLMYRSELSATLRSIWGENEDKFRQRCMAIHIWNKHMNKIRASITNIGNAKVGNSH